MKKRNLIHILLSCAAILLFIVIWFLPNQDTEQTTRPLTTLDPLAVERIRITNNNGPSFEIVRMDGVWRMQTPYDIEANTPRIEILLDLVSTPSLEQLAAPSTELKQFGLDKPRATVEFNKTQLIVGGTHPYNYRRYIQNGDQLHLTKDAFPHHLLALAEDFISHAIFLPDEQITSIKSDRWELKQDEQKKWSIDPPSATLNSDDLANLVEEWNHSWAKKVVQIPKDKAEQQIELSFSGKSLPIQLEIVKKKKELILIRRDRGVAYRLPAASIFQIPTGE